MAKNNNSNDVLLTNIIKGIEEVKGNDIDIQHVIILLFVMEIQILK
jgi:hypothetical protein